jgi:hypothetical protein
LGIVHGAIHGRNVIVRPDGSIALTHISPLLYNEPEVDMEALRPLLEQMHYASEFSLLPASPHTSRESHAEAARVRRRALIGAALVALLGVLIALVLWYLGSRVAADSTSSSDSQPDLVSQTIQPGALA